MNILDKTSDWLSACHWLLFSVRTQDKALNFHPHNKHEKSAKVR